MGEFQPDSGLLGRTLKAQYFKNFTVLRYARLEETPEEAAGGVLGGERANLSKHSPHFFADIVTGINNGVLPLVRLKIIADPQIQKRCDEFIQFVEALKKNKFATGKNADKEDVAKADEFLDLILKTLR